MKCFLARDLLPFYIENRVSKETKYLLEQHFAECENCRRLFKSVIKSADELKESIDIDSNGEIKKNRDFWRKYYGSLYINGISIFFIAFILVVTLIKFIGHIIAGL